MRLHSKPWFWQNSFTGSEKFLSTGERRSTQQLKQVIASGSMTFSLIQWAWGLIDREQWTWLDRNSLLIILVAFLVWQNSFPQLARPLPNWKAGREHLWLSNSLKKGAFENKQTKNIKKTGRNTFGKGNPKLKCGTTKLVVSVSVSW